MTNQRCQIQWIFLSKNKHISLLRTRHNAFVLNTLYVSDTLVSIFGSRKLCRVLEMSNIYFTATKFRKYQFAFF